jgi:hypothetical protein
MFFLGRWRSVYHFEMSDVRPERRGDCIKPTRPVDRSTLCSNPRMALTTVRT